jgi:hypothetical protein
LSAVWLFLATVTCYLNCLDRAVLAHRSEHWLHFQSAFLSLAVGQIQHLPWVQNGPVWFEKLTVCKKQYMCWMMTILCHWDFNEQIEKLVRLLLYTGKNCSRKFQAWVYFVTIQISEHWKSWMKWEHNFFQNPLQ